MTPRQLYQTDLAQPHFLADPEQAQAVVCLQSLYDDLLQPRVRSGFVDRLRGRPLQPRTGLYLWGDVGRGKTYLMDCFYNSVPGSEKQRWHFSEFMRYVHAEIGKLTSVPNPLNIIAAHVASEIRLLCLDEFHVDDIGDAMLLSGLLEGLFSHGVTLVMTSNVVPDELYKNGLQRARFLPAIALIKQHTRSISLNGGVDYRKHGIEGVAGSGQVYPVMPATDAHAYMLQRYTALSGQAPSGERKSLSVNQRDIWIMACSKGVLWGDFHELCATYRSSGDYLEIAAGFDTLLITHIPVITEEADAAAQRFIHLVDALYDNDTRLITTLAAVPDYLYSGRRMRFSFRRAASRLYEMAG